MEINSISGYQLPLYQATLSSEDSLPESEPRSKDTYEGTEVRKPKRKKHHKETSAQETPPEEPAAEPSSSSGKGTKITLIHTNDLHAYLKSMPELAGIIQELRKEHPDAILVDGGDVAYNPPVSDHHHFEPMPEIMNQIGYDIQLLGNHEFQWPEATLEKEYVGTMKADLLCANVRDKKTHDYLPGVKPYVIKEVNGVKIGFIGVVTPDMATSAHPDVGKDVQKLGVEEELKKLIPEVRSKGADIIVVLSHEGVSDDQKLAKDVQGIDLILAAHDHALTKQPVEVGSYPSKTYIIESQSHAKFVGETTLEVDPEKKELIAVNMKQIPTANSVVKPDPEVEKITDAFMGRHGIREVPEYMIETPDISSFMDSMPITLQDTQQP